MRKMQCELIRLYLALAISAAVGSVGSVGCILYEGREVSSRIFYFKSERQNTSVGRITGRRTCHGDINSLRPSGQAGKGVPGSQAEVRVDIPELKKRWTFYQRVADQNCIQASLLAALASRESRGGALLYKTDGYGDFGRAYGILQCDLEHSGLDCLACIWYSECHIQMMVSQLLVPYIKQIQRKFPSWTLSQSLQGGTAAYNKGVSRVTSWSGVDTGTTHGDYSNDVIARAQYLYRQGWN